MQMSPFMKKVYTFLKPTLRSRHRKKNILNCFRFANKQDKEGALSENDIELQFELELLGKKCKSPYKVVRL